MSSDGFFVYQKIHWYKYATEVSVRPKGFFSFRPKPKIAETAIFLFGRNRYRNRKKVSLSAETDTETETTVLKKSAII